MALIHDVIDSDVRFIIDPVTRTISNQDSNKLVLTRGDHNSERFTFEIPRYVEGHDMSLCNVVRIHYINTDSKTRQEMADVYEPDDVSLCPDNDQLLIFSWLISNTATNFAGNLAFAIEFQCVVDGTVIYAWRTAANSTITIVDGINNTDSVAVTVGESPTDIYPTIQKAAATAMIHDVVDSDVRFAIDPITRAISNKEHGKLMLVKGDHNSERFTFEIPRHVEGHDISLCNVVRIHYINTDAKSRLTSVDIYEPDDLCVCEDDEDLVTFTWLISRNATVYAGSLAFTIEFQCVRDGDVLYAWHTGINNTISICDGISNSKSIVGNYSDILTNWWQRFYGDSTLPIEVHTMESFEALNGDTKENTLYLLEDDPTLDELLQLILSMQEEIAALTARILALENGVVKPEDPEEPEDPDNPNPEDPDNPTPEDPDDPVVSVGSYSVKVDETFTIPYSALMSGIVIIYPEEYLSASIETNQTTFTALKVGSCTITVADRGTDIYYYSVTISEREHQHAYIFIKTVPASCTAKGYDLYRCDCEAEEQRNSTDMLDHTWSYYQDTSAGETGWSRKCTVCNTIETDVVYGCTDGGDHTWVEEVVIDPTCIDPKYQKYRCSICNETKQEAIGEPLGHNYVESVVTDNTCTEPAIQKYVCSRCQTEKPFEEKDIVRPALGHDYQEEAIRDATCTEPSYQVYKCSRCPSTYDQQYGPPDGHNWSAAIYDEVGYYEPTCEEPGRAKYVCDVCLETKSEMVDPLQHEWEEPVYNGAGYVCTCRNCGETKNITAEGCDHTDELTDSASATCETGGYSTYTCSLCGRVETREETDPLGHNWSGWTTTIEPTCTDDGSRYRTCSRCDKSNVESISAQGHKTTFVKGTPATCTESGVGDRNICDVCGEIVTGESYLAPLGHDYVTTTVDATCTTGGYKTHTCSRCGNTYTSDETDPNGHHYPDGWEEKTAPTCTEAGVKIRYCEKCYQYEEGAIDPTGHSYTSEVVPATCTTGGYTKHTCTRCGDSYTTDETEANGHDFRTGWETVTAATCTTPGADKRVCFTCGHTENKDVAALGHDYVTQPIDPDNYHGDGVSSSGYVDVCTRCGDRNYDQHT